MNISLDDDKIDSIVSAAAAELEAMLTKSASDDSPGEQSMGSSGPSDPDADEGAEAPPAEASAPPADDAGGAPPGAEASAPPPGDPAMGAEDPAAAGGAPSVEELQQAYSQLPVDQLKMHYLAAKAALVQSMGQPDAGAAPGADMGAAPPAPGPEASAPPMGGAPAAPPAASPPMPPEMGKSEAFAARKALEAKVEELSKALNEQKSLAKANDEALLKLTEIVSMPVRKSAKGVSDMPFIGRAAGDEPSKERQPLTKAQVDVKLKSKIRDGSLTKSDKDLVAKYAVGALDISKIEHLLVDASK